MSPKLDSAQATIISKKTTQPQVIYLSRSAKDYPNQVQWTVLKGTHSVHFPAGVFKGGKVDLKITGHTPQPDPPMELLPPNPGQEDETYPDYIDVQVQGSARTMSIANPPIIIVKA